MIAEFTEVTLKHDVDGPGIHLPAGSRGVVMAIWMDGEAYEVEFDRPVPTVVRLSAEAIQGD